MKMSFSLASFSLENDNNDLENSPEQWPGCGARLKNVSLSFEGIILT